MCVRGSKSTKTICLHLHYHVHLTKYYTQRRENTIYFIVCVRVSVLFHGCFWNGFNHKYMRWFSFSLLQIYFMRYEKPSATLMVGLFCARVNVCVGVHHMRLIWCERAFVSAIEFKIYTALCRGVKLYRRFRLDISFLFFFWRLTQFCEGNRTPNTHFWPFQFIYVYCVLRSKHI